MTLETQLELSLRLLVAAFLSAVVGLDRERTDHPAGLRTHMLVGIGAALFTVLSIYAFTGESGRVAAQIVTGIGFLGAGSIVQSKTQGTRGITTAAGIWSTAALGMACGAGLYLLAALSALIIWFVLAIIHRVEQSYHKEPPTEPDDPQSKERIEVVPGIPKQPIE